MARQIKETPVLTGKDARRFLQNAEQAKANKATQKEMEIMRESAKRFKVVN